MLPVTSHQDFFGISVVEAVAAGVYPLLPYRLAFPEIIDSNRNSENFYNEGMLESCLRNNLQQCASQELRNAVIRFDWTQMVNKYDEIFEHLS